MNNREPGEIISVGKAHELIIALQKAQMSNFLIQKIINNPGLARTITAQVIRSVSPIGTMPDLAEKIMENNFFGLTQWEKLFKVRAGRNSDCLFIPWGKEILCSPCPICLNGKLVCETHLLFWGPRIVYTQHSTEATDYEVNLKTLPFSDPENWPITSSKRIKKIREETLGGRWYLVCKYPFEKYQTYKEYVESPVSDEETCNHLRDLPNQYVIGTAIEMITAIKMARVLKIDFVKDWWVFCRNYIETEHPNPYTRVRVKETTPPLSKILVESYPENKGNAAVFISRLLFS